MPLLNGHNFHLSAPEAPSTEVFQNFKTLAKNISLQRPTVDGSTMLLNSVRLASSATAFLPDQKVGPFYLLSRRGLNARYQNYCEVLSIAIQTAWIAHSMTKFIEQKKVTCTLPSPSKVPFRLVECREGQEFSVHRRSPSSFESSIYSAMGMANFTGLALSIS